MRCWCSGSFQRKLWYIYILEAVAEPPLSMTLDLTHSLCRSNPYHNSTHAADVVQAVMFILIKDNLASKFSGLEVLAMILAAAIHDVGHPGVTNPFLRASKVRLSSASQSSGICSDLELNKFTCVLDCVRTGSSIQDNTRQSMKNVKQIIRTDVIPCRVT